MWIKEKIFRTAEFLYVIFGSKIRVFRVKGKALPIFFAAPNPLPEVREDPKSRPPPGEEKLGKKNSGLLILYDGPRKMVQLYLVIGFIVQHEGDH